MYAVDSELGELVWKKTFATPSTCGNIQVVTEPPQVIHFGARPAAKPGAPAPPPRPPEEPLPRDQRRVGAAAGGGYFGLRGVYAVTSDGYIHEQIMATGLDYAPPVKFLGPQNGSSFALNMNDKVVYTATGQGCRNVPNAVWSIDLNTPGLLREQLQNPENKPRRFIRPGHRERRHSLCRDRQRACGASPICQQRGGPHRKRVEGEGLVYTSER